jgi:hypothetical protein
MQEKESDMKFDGDEMLDDYSEYLDGGVQGKYYERVMRFEGLVKLDPDVLETFPDSSDVNEALRAFMREARKRLGENITAHEAIAGWP